MPMLLTWVSLAFIAGVITASRITLPLFAWLAIAASAAAIAFATRRLHLFVDSLVFARLQRAVPGFTPAFACVLLVFAGLGAARYQLTMPTEDASQVAWYNDLGGDLTITGTIIEAPDVRDAYTNLRVQVHSIDTGSGLNPAKGTVLVRTAANTSVAYGNVVTGKGRLITPPSDEEFSYADYLARQGIRSYMTHASVQVQPGWNGNVLLRALYNLRDYLVRTTYQLFPDPEASLLSGILFGVDSGLPAAVTKAFNKTGTTHIIAISGFNMSIIAGIFMSIFRRFWGARRGAIAAAAGIGVYAVFVGSSPAVMRAALMSMIALFALQIGRRQTGVIVLSFVAATMAVGNPLVLWDVGFQLSVLATMGIILYGSAWSEWVEGRLTRWLPPAAAVYWAGILADVLLLTMAAQLTTLPVIAYHFRQISLISPLANAFILPAQPLVMVLGGVAVLLGAIWWPMGKIASAAAWPLTAYTIRTVELFAALPRQVLYLDSAPLAVVASAYLLIFGVTAAAPHRNDIMAGLKKHLRSVTIGGIAVAVLITTAFAWRVALTQPDGRLHLTFLDVGSADAVLIQTPGGRRVLVNGGPSASKLSDALGRRLSPLDHSLDWLVIASAQEEQVSALPRVIQRYPPRNVMLAGKSADSYSAGVLIQAIADENIPITEASAGQTLDLGGGAKLRVVDVSASGATLMLEWGNFRALLPIGSDKTTIKETDSASTIGRVDVLLLAQSGKANANPADWLLNLSPRLAVISVSAADKNGLPDASVLSDLAGKTILRTDRSGAVEVTTDGAQMWVRSERQPAAP